MKKEFKKGFYRALGYGLAMVLGGILIIVLGITISIVFPGTDFNFGPISVR